MFALEALRKPQLPSRLIVTRRQVENYFARFPVRGFDCIHNARARFCRDDEAIHQHQDGLVEADIQQRLRRGKLEDLPALIEPVESGLAQIEETGFDLIA